MGKQIIHISIFIVISFWIESSFAQPDSLFETMVENSDTDDNLSELLEYLYIHPININTASLEEIQQLPILNPEQIDLIIKNRPYKDKRAFRLKLGYDLYHLIHPYIVAKDKRRTLKFNFVQRLQYTLEQSDGFKRKKYLGTPLEAYSRLYLQYAENFIAGLLIQKDVGERNLHDHLSGFIQWQNTSKKSKLILGNFQVRLGQGLILSSPYSIRRGAYAVAPLRPNYPEGRFYLSSNECSGFIGVFLGHKISKFLSLAGFISKRSQDAQFSEDDQHIVGINYSGYHRTMNEVLSKSILSERTLGGFMELSIYNNNRVGISTIKTHYDPTISPESNMQNVRKDYFRFSGKIINAHSFFYTSKYKGLYISGEIAANNWKKLAYQHSLFVSIKHLKAGGMWWRIPIDYHSPFGRSFSNNSSFPRGKQGTYVALAMKLNSKIRINSYWYLEKKLWRTYFNPMPIQSRVFFTQLDWKFAYKTNLLFRFQSSNDSFYPVDVMKSITDKQYNFRLQIEKKVTENIRLRSRIEQTFINYSNILSDVQGINVYQDLFWCVKPGISLSLRFSSFSTSNYDARIYEYESDLPGAYSTYPLYGKGIKWYIQYSFQILDLFQIWFKYRHIYFDGMEAIGSGYAKISGDTRQDIRFQIRYEY